MINLFLLLLVIVLLIPQSLAKTVRKGWPFFACLLTVFFLSFTVQELTEVKPDQLQVRSLYAKNEDSEGFEIWLKSIVINDETFKPGEIFSAGWIDDEEALKWRAYDQIEGMTRTVSAPFEPGTEVELFFQTNQWRGKVEVIYGSEKQTLDCYSAVDTFDQTASVKLIMPQHAGQGFSLSMKKVVLLVLALLVILNIVYMIVYYLRKKHFPRGIKVSAGRELWLDVLKVVSGVMVVLIHSCGPLYNNAFSDNSSLWLKGLWINAIPRFAVPCFLMISGALLIRKEYNFDKALLHKVARILLPLAFWSAMYVILQEVMTEDKGNMMAELLKIPFKHQNSTLWYGYQLIWLYLGMPFWQTLYRYLTTRMRWMFVVFSLVIPGVLTMFGELSLLGVPEYLPFGSINVMVCYVGMLFLGCLLYDIVNTLPAHRGFLSGIGLAAAGLGIMVLASFYVSKASGQSVHNFFSEVRIPGVIYGSGIFLMAGSLKGWFGKWPGMLKSWVYSISGISLGIYMIHGLILNIFPSIWIGGREISRNNPSVSQVLMSFVLYYGITATGCFLASRLPGLKKLVL